MSAPDFVAIMASLTPAQRDAIVYTAKGFTEHEIARLMERSGAAVRRLRSAAYVRLEVSGACEAAVIVAKSGLV